MTAPAITRLLTAAFVAGGVIGAAAALSHPVGIIRSFRRDARACRQRR